MPGMNGIDVLRILKKNPRTFHIPVILMYSYGDLKKDGMVSGAVSFVEKPINIEQLSILVQKILEVLV